MSSTLCCFRSDTTPRLNTCCNWTPLLLPTYINSIALVFHTSNETNDFLHRAGQIFLTATVTLSFLRPQQLQICTMWWCQLLQQRNEGRSRCEIIQPKSISWCCFSPVSSVPDSANYCCSLYFISASLFITICIWSQQHAAQTHKGFCVIADLLFVLPTQLPWSSGAKPVMHLGFALQTKEPTLFSHTKPAAQLWVCKAHSSTSAKKAHMNTMNGWVVSRARHVGQPQGRIVSRIVHFITTPSLDAASHRCSRWRCVSRSG